MKNYWNKLIILMISILSIILNAVCVNALPFFNFTKKGMEPHDLLIKYMNCINESRFIEMYSMLDDESQKQVSVEDFISRNKNIYEGIKAENLTVNVTEVDKKNKDEIIVKYDTAMDTIAINIAFSNEATFILDKDKRYGLKWKSNLIFPQLDDGDRIKINALKAKRGNILDRNGEIIAGPGVASSIGIIPEKLEENKEINISEISKILDISVDEINRQLSAPYVKKTTFVPIKTISKGQVDLENSILRIPGVMIKDVEVRVYPYGEKTSHLVGYIQNISLKELESYKDKEYNKNSIIGKAGLERIYEEKLRGIDGHEILITNTKGKKITIAKKNEKNGEDVKLTIDVHMQCALYDEFTSDKSSSIAINNKTGEVLALVSTPAFNSNDFIVGMSKNKWNSLNEDANKPLFNRFKACLCPGSTFKPIVAAIGLNTGKIRSEDDYGHSGLHWQKNPAWGSYFVKTLKEYNDVSNLRNALIYSDNIYFAKAALNIGKDILKKELLNIGFNEDIPFDFKMNPSSFSNSGEFNGEIQLADSGYGQGQMLVNPLHMVCMYSSFFNDGSMIKPYILYKDSKTPELWKENVFSKEVSDVILSDLTQVVEQGIRLAQVNGVPLAGKTGTAEIKKSKDDKTGTEVGWFCLFNADKNIERPLLIMSMVEDVKDRGGSSYLIQKVKKFFE